jgi:hypothetical protein
LINIETYISQSSSAPEGAQIPCTNRLNLPIIFLCDFDAENFVASNLNKKEKERALMKRSGMIGNVFLSYYFLTGERE